MNVVRSVQAPLAVLSSWLNGWKAVLPHAAESRSRRWLLTKPALIGLHAVLVCVGYVLAWWTRFDFSLPPASYLQIAISVPVLLGIRLVFFRFSDLFSSWWRYASLPDLIALFKSTLLGSALFLTAAALLGWVGPIPRSVFPLEWLFTLVLIGGTRVSVRLYTERRSLAGRNGPPRAQKRVLLCGAGDAGYMLAREMLAGPDTGHQPVAFLDDDPAKHGFKILGIPIVGALDAIGSIGDRIPFDEVVIAMPSAGPEKLRRAICLASQTGRACKILPPLRTVLGGNHARLAQLRPIETGELLGREPVDLPMEVVACDLQGESILITGAAGSVGSELARQVVQFSPQLLVLLDQNENGLHMLTLELEQLCPGAPVRAVVGDIVDRTRMQGVFDEFRPTRLFHAAAYKHVPLMEGNVIEAVKNNVLGTDRLIEAACAHGVQIFVLISTDKAVRPSSVMGATKRAGELIVDAWTGKSQTRFVTVRFGNVLGSSGSVLPIFENQLRDGNPLTVTHLEATRYLMSIREAAQLVLLAASRRENHDRKVMLEMGQPVNIEELAQRIVRLQGMEPYTDVPIVFTGLRPGEKLHEALIDDCERAVPSQDPGIRLLETPPVDAAGVAAAVADLAESVARGRNEKVLERLCALVPGFSRMAARVDVAAAVMETPGSRNVGAGSDVPVSAPRATSRVRHERT